MTIWLILPGLVLSSFVLTAGLRRYALARQLVDVPNVRSSHAVPTPRGGGVAIVLCFLLALPFLFGAGYLSSAEAWALFGSGAWIAAIGFLDDHGHVAARWRLLAHFVGAGWLLWLIGGLPALHLLGFRLDFGGFGYIFGALYLVWLLNLYNFMDGIDGIASIEAICVCLGGAGLYFLVGMPQAMIVPLSLAAAVCGFLLWNFPPARIFMGDAGSGFLGIVLGALSLQAGWVEPTLFVGWLVLLGVFIVDATWTLFRRLLRGDKVYEAHRSHAYQYASRSLGRHLPVTLAVGVINLVWLLPWAGAAVLGKVDGGLALVISYAPLLGLAICFNAGEREATA
jgi:Fuc2NAc and GlcNAc transferase